MKGTVTVVAVFIFGCIAGYSGILTVANTGEGWLSWLMRDIVSSPISSRRYTFSTSNSEAMASATIFSPSTMNSPNSSLNFFCDRDLSRFISLEDNFCMIANSPLTDFVGLSGRVQCKAPRVRGEGVYFRK